jgi:hypothetical protein
MRARLLAILASLALTAAAAAQSTAFTYQGRLTGGGSPAIGSHDLRFTLYGVPAGGTIVAGPICADNVNVADGLFTVPLDFGAVFDGNERWLEIGVRADATPGNCGTGAYTPLSPRQALTAAPYALSVRVPLTLSGTSATHIIRGQNASTTGGAAGVFGESTAVSGGTYGGQFRCASPDGAVGVAGQANSATGFTYGVVGINFSTSGVGVRGNALASSGTTYGVVGTTLSPNGYAGYFTGPAGSRNYFEQSVGIGTTAPTHTVHIASPTPTLALQDTDSTTQQVGYISFRDSANSERAWVGYGTPGSPDFSIVNARSGGNIVLSPFSGGVGIGTSTPSRRLTVWDTMSVEASPGFMPILGIPRPGTTNFRASMFIDPGNGDGVVTGDRKSFREINPADPTTDIWYVCLEGPEAAMYVRGTARLANGRALIELPAHFRSLALEEGMTVQLTPLSAQSKGLAVTRKSLNGVEVTELADGKGDYAFDWEVKAVRKRYENYQAVKPWDEFLPSDSDRETAWQERAREIERNR